MRIEVNGDPREVPEGTSVEDLVTLLELRTELVAVEVNRTLVGRAERASRPLLAGDRVEIVTLVGGG
ncbi:MAG: sulfur carrier protein ThiS [Planctomycetota bacterium]